MKKKKKEQGTTRKDWNREEYIKKAVDHCLLYEPYRTHVAYILHAVKPKL